MRFRLFHLFYFLSLLLVICASLAGLWPFFISTAIASLLTGVTYQLFLKTGRQVSQPLIMIHLGLVVIGLTFTLSLYRAFSAVAGAGAPDTAALSADWLFFLGPLCLLTGLIIFIVVLSTSKRV